MTLVVAALRGDEIQLVADTMISFDPRLGRKPYDALKILFLSPTTVLAFSGAHERAMQIFFELCETQAYRLEISDLVERVSQMRKQKSRFSLHEELPDFLIARCAPKASIYRVNDYGVSDCSSYGWIGNNKAAAILSRDIDPNNIVDLATALNRIVDEGKFADVGGHVVHARGSIEGFKFVPTMRLVSPRYLPKEGWNTVDFGSAQSGGFGFTTITPNCRGQNGYGVYFFQGYIGLFFHIDPVKRVGETLKAYTSSAEEFMEILAAEVGFTLEHCGSLG